MHQKPCIIETIEGYMFTFVSKLKQSQVKKTLYRYLAEYLTSNIYNFGDCIVIKKGLNPIEVYVGNLKLSYNTTSIAFFERK